jgi:hypothetical protein
VAVAKQKNQAAARDSLGTEFGRFLDDIGLRSPQLCQERHGPVKIGQACGFRINNRIEGLVRHG